VQQVLLRAHVVLLRAVLNDRALHGSEELVEDTFFLRPGERSDPGYVFTVARYLSLMLLHFQRSADCARIDLVVAAEPHTCTDLRAESAELCELDELDEAIVKMEEALDEMQVELDGDYLNIDDLMEPWCLSVWIWPEWRANNNHFDDEGDDMVVLDDYGNIVSQYGY
jgi:hypothetical protein